MPRGRKPWKLSTNAPHNNLRFGTRSVPTDDLQLGARTMRTRHYETDDETFSADAYTVDHYDGIAWRVYGWETAPDEDTEWSGIEERTGRVVCVMVGDDRRFSFDPS